MSNTKKIVNPKFVPDDTKKSSRVYSNYVSITHTGLDFTLNFLDVPPPNKENIEEYNKGKNIKAPLQCSVVVPNALIPLLINALNKQYEKFQKNTTKSKNRASSK